MGTIASLGRLQQISTVVARHGLGHYLEQRKRKGGRHEPEGDGSTIPASARRFRAILEDLGPTFIKFGQVLSTRADILPVGFAEALRGLQDDCPPMPAGEAHAAIEQALGKPLSQLFREIDDDPVASASIAQVHRAVTLEGDEVAVKVQRPRVREQIMRDLDLLAFLAELAESIVLEAGMVTPRDIIEEFEDAFLGELDFLREARNMKRFEKNLEGEARPYIVPKVYSALSSRTVLTMQYIRGTRLADIGPAHDKKKIAANIVSSAFEQVFVDGLFHADPHPGNSFILSDNRLALLDFGSVGEVSYAMRQTLLVLVVSIGLRDAETVARLLYRVGIPDERVSLHRLRDAAASLFDQYLRDRSTLANIEATKLLEELFDLAARFRVRIPSEYALIARAGMTVEGIIRELDPELEVLEVAQPYIRRLLNEQLALPELGDETMRNLLRARSVMSELPLMASQILMDLELGKLQIQVSSRALDAVARNIDALGITVLMGMVAAGLILGSAFLLARYEVQFWMPLAGFLLASSLLGAAFGRWLLAPRLRKLSLGRLLLGRRRRK
jgi:ubiquinone biosynthesis protein